MTQFRRGVFGEHGITRVSLLGGNARSPEASAILKTHSGRIDQFVAANRQQYALSLSQHLYRRISHPELDIVYRNQMGVETLILIPKPPSPSPSKETPVGKEDIMLDGYVGLLVTAHDSPLLLEMRLEIIINGVSTGVRTFVREPSFFSVGTYTSRVILTFGKDALRSRSVYNDTRARKKLLNKIAPSRKDKRLFRYPFLGSRSGRLDTTPEQLLSGDIVPEHKAAIRMPLEADIAAFFPAGDLAGAGFDDQVNFEDILLSPLNPLGPNIIRVVFTVTPVLSGLEGTYSRSGVVWGEFYSRNPKSFRQVNTSWHWRDTSGANSILVNDRPQVFAQPFLMDIPEITSGQEDVDFSLDLTPETMSGQELRPNDYWGESEEDSDSYTDALGEVRTPDHCYEYTFVAPYFSDERHH